MRQFNVFNYHGQYHEKQHGSSGIPYDEDVELLEREIEHVIRAGTSQGQQRSSLDKNIVNMAVSNNRNRTQTAGTAPVAGGRRRKIPKHNSIGIVGTQPYSHKKMGSMQPIHSQQV